ncbi:MAG TPA: hypothetical protein DCL13_07095 [Peptococcaceae bacterium]|nr:hypothetical protein [Peptococcaceae bacterium]
MLFRDRPLIRLGPDAYVLFNVFYLAEKTTEGIFWSIFDNLTGDDRNRFAELYGRLLQDYVAGDEIKGFYAAAPGRRKRANSAHLPGVAERMGFTGGAIVDRPPLPFL